MATALGTHVNRYLGKSTDFKPKQDIPVDSVYKEIDTGRILLWDGTNWVDTESKRAIQLRTSQIEYQIESLAELKKIRTHLEILTEQYIINGEIIGE